MVGGSRVGNRAVIFTLCGFMTFGVMDTVSAQSAPVNLPAAGALRPASAPVAVAVPNLSLGNNVRVMAARDLSQLRSVPVVALGGARLDLSALVSADSPFNSSVQRLQRLSNLVTVRDVQSQLIETNRGFIINQTMTVKPRLGACSTNRAQLNQAADICGNRTTLGASISAISTPGNPRYLASPQARQRAQQALELSAQRLSQGVRSARQSLSDPRVVQLLGQAEINRLQALSDDDLAAEMIDAAETVISEAVFIPNINNLTPFQRLNRFSLAPQLGPQEIARAQQRLQEQLVRAKPQNLNLEQTTFLTGFTFGREYEWRKRIQKTVNWCFVGCAETHYIEPYAKLGFGLGLRFPIKANLEFDYQSGNTASLKTRFAAIDGNEQDYRAAGLESAKVFQGKEFVAQYAALAGINWRLLDGHQNFQIGSEEDFTQQLPPPFTGGNFLPPSPGRPTPVLTKVFDRIDLLGNNVDYGIVGAKVHPAVDIQMTSAELSLTVKDELSGRKTRVGSGQTVAVNVDRQAGQSRFTLGEPRYNLAFNLKPGLQYQIYVDLVVWEKQWIDTFWIPQLQVTLPPGGVDFSCHAGTNCARQFLVDLSSGASNAVDRNASLKDCRDGKALAGVWSLKDRASGQYVRGGVTAEGRNDIVGALAGTSKPTNPRSWEAFEMVFVRDAGGQRWLRNTVSGRYLETVNRSSSLLLPPNRACDPNNPDMRWRFWQVKGGKGLYKLQNMRTEQFVRVARDGVLKADATSDQASVFVLERVR